MSGAGALLLEARALDLRVAGRRLVAGLDWQVRAGEFWCVLGPNGIGKSSLLHAAAGLLPLAQGGFWLGGEPLSALSASRLALLRGLLLQHQHDAFSMPVVEAVMAGLFARGGGWGQEAADRRIALAALARVGLSSLVASDLLALSGGERQRVALATLLAQDPGLLLLDEPTSHQDIAAQLQIMQLARELAADGKAVVASCHDLNLARRFASHVLLLGPAGVQAGAAAQVLQPHWLAAAFGCRFRLVGEGAQALLVADPA